MKFLKKVQIGPPLAIELAEKEQRLSAHGLRHEAMEVDEIRQPQGHKRDFDRKSKKPRTDQKAKKNDFLCFRCSKPGHFKAQCRIRLPQSDNAMETSN